MQLALSCSCALLGEQRTPTKRKERRRDAAGTPCGPRMTVAGEYG